MSATPGDSTHQTKRVVLPSGKTIEVVMFGAEQDKATGRTPGTGTELHICPECQSGLAYPVRWEAAGPEAWNVEIRCPECEHRHEGVYDEDTVDSFDAELDSGTEVLVADYRRLMRANMADEVDRFVDALAADAVWPEDF